MYVDWAATGTGIHFTCMRIERPLGSASTLHVCGLSSHWDRHPLYMYVDNVFNVALFNPTLLSYHLVLQSYCNVQPNNKETSIPNVWHINALYKQVFLLRNFCLSDFNRMQLENLHHLSNLRDNVQFNVIWHRHTLAALVLCRRLAASDITATPSFHYMDWFCWWYKGKR